MAMFNSYVKLPEGISYSTLQLNAKSLVQTEMDHPPISLHLKICYAYIMSKNHLKMFGDCTLPIQIIELLKNGDLPS